MLYQLTTTYACAGIWVDERRIVDAAPIYRNLIGKTARELVRHQSYVACVPVLGSEPCHRCGTMLEDMPVTKEPALLVVCLPCINKGRV